MLALTQGCWVSPAAAAPSTVNSTNRHAYGANFGWIDARADVTNGVRIGGTYCSGFAWSANCGWICLGSAPTNGWRYSNASAGDCGVNHDGTGNLSGYAYGANIGWVLFEQTNGQPRVDLRSGALSGSAWSANLGWISLSNSQAFVQIDALATGADTDTDGIPDEWEMQHAGNLGALGGAYPDGDDVPDADEYAADTDPMTPDHLRIVSLARTNSTSTVAWTARPTRMYRVEATNSLRPGGSWRDAGGGLIGPPSTASAQAAIPIASQSGEFYRVSAVLPLSE